MLRRFFCARMASSVSGWGYRLVMIPTKGLALPKTLEELWCGDFTRKKLLRN